MTDNIDANYDLSLSDLEIGTPEPSAPIDEGQPNEVSSQDPSPQMFKYTANGKEIEEPLDAVLKRASMGYNYAQHMEQLKSQQSELESQRQQVQEMQSKWKPYHDFAEQNPTWADTVRQSYENMLNGEQNSTQQNLNESQLPAALKQELEELKSFKAQYEQDRQALQQEREDALLNTQIQEVQKAYPDIDFSRTDPETGKSLEFEVLEHAQTNGIQNFKAAFRDFYYDNLIKLTATKAKENALKELQERTKKGFITESDTSILNKPTNASSIKNSSYHELVMEGGKELNLF